jgi:acyl-CoA synthetase (AMP-forming)/AMP-acid ligase II
MYSILNYPISGIWCCTVFCKATVLLQVAYGMTETSPVSFMSVPGDTTEMQATTVGCIFDHTEVNIFYNIKSLLKLH